MKEPKLSALAIYGRGLLMGIADLIPGVSGGTIAVLMGIYQKFVLSLARFDLQAIQFILRLRIVALWHHVNAGFLLLIFAGIVTSILIFSRVMAQLLETVPYYLFALFSGLLLASVKTLYNRYCHNNKALFTVGTLLAISIGLLPQASITITPFTIMVSAAIAICAMVLPGISGSFLLLTLGVYHQYVRAVANLDFSFIGYFILGSTIGILALCQFLKYLLSRFEEQTMSLMSGFVLGSVVLLWPYKDSYSEQLSIWGNSSPFNTELLLHNHIFIVLFFIIGYFFIKWIESRGK